MEEVLRPEQPEVPPESLHEHLELSHYIDVFRSSAERVRRVIFIIMVFSVVMLVAQWNTTELSWMPYHYKGLESMYSEISKIPDEAQADARVREKTDGQLWTREELKNYIADFLSQRMDRVNFVEIPGLGVTFDINDLGNFSGISFSLLLTLLLFSLAREHENLYLAMFKVRRLHDHGKRKSDGESVANYLYHSLAMSQVLNSPPTLAQWAPSKWRARFLYLIFLVPALVEGCVTYANLKTLKVPKTLGREDSVMILQYIFFALTLSLGLLAIIYSRSCDRRWERAFFYINPALRRVRSRPWYVWVGLKRDSLLHRRMWNQAVDNLVVTEKAPRVKAPVRVEASVQIPEGGKISYQAMNELRAKLERRAAEAARLQETWVSEAPREVKSSILSDDQWQVAASFFEHGPFRNTVPSRLRPEQEGSIHTIVELLVRLQLEDRHDELERLMHPSALLVGPGFTLENRGATTVVVTCPFIVRYRLEDVIHQESGRDVTFLAYENGAWLVISRTLLVDKAECT